MKQYPNYSDEKFGICVVCRRGETTEELVKRFRKKFSKSGIIKEVREKMQFEKPSIRKRKKRAQAILLAKKEQKKITTGFKKRRYFRKEKEDEDKSSQ